MSTGKYQKRGDPVGEGSYGIVWKATNQENSMEVAMKKVIGGEKGPPTTTTREIDALRKLKNHPNIVTLHEVYSEIGSNGSPGDKYLVFEYAPYDLTGFMNHKKLTLTESKCLTHQLLQGLDCCHRAQIMHRDLKPSNILLMADGTLKLCDFGLCRLFETVKPGPWTQEVITIWYRPPELLLGCKTCLVSYDFSVDIWSAGCIVGEMLLAAPLFPGDAEFDVLKKIRNRLAVNVDDWPTSIRTENWTNFWQVAPGKSAEGGLFADLKLEHGSPCGCVEFLQCSIHMDPTQRMDTEAILKHGFLAERLCPKQVMKMPPDGSNMKEMDIIRAANKGEINTVHASTDAPAEPLLEQQRQGSKRAATEPSCTTSEVPCKKRKAAVQDMSTCSTLTSWTLKELRQECKRLGIACYVTKAWLLQRLEEEQEARTPSPNPSKLPTFLTGPPRLSGDPFMDGVDLHSLNDNQLVALAKLRAVKAKGKKTEELLERLLEQQHQGTKRIATETRCTASEVPCKKRKAAVQDMNTLRSKTLKELKQECKRLGIACYVTKAEILERLQKLEGQGSKKAATGPM